MVETKECVEVELTSLEPETELRYGWGNEKKKTWFITKEKKAFVPKGSRLLLVLDCLPSSKSISIKSTSPQVGDIIQDMDGDRLEVVKVNWY